MYSVFCSQSVLPPQLVDSTVSLPPAQPGPVDNVPLSQPVDSTLSCLLSKLCASGIVLLIYVLYNKVLKI